jgi:hypothetical protein
MVAADPSFALAAVGQRTGPNNLTSFTGDSALAGGGAAHLFVVRELFLR